MKNIFCTGTGRCGTSTLARALEHAKGYTVGQESHIGHNVLIEPVSGYYTYPDNHIEVSPHLALSISPLVALYPSACWVHIRRSRETCVRSLMDNCKDQMLGFVHQWFQIEDCTVEQASGLFYDVMDYTIQESLKNQHYVQIDLESAWEQWPKVWDYLGLEGDMAKSRQEWKRKYNSTNHRGKDSYVTL